jgi:hypothetical protein
LQSQRNRRHSMTQELVAQLEEAGMEWDTTMVQQEQEEPSSSSSRSNAPHDENEKKKTNKSTIRVGIFSPQLPGKMRP